MRSRALEAIAEGNQRAGQELELISALDLETVPWSCLAVKSGKCFFVLNYFIDLGVPELDCKKSEGDLGETASPDVDEMPLKSKSESLLNPETFREGVWKRSLVARHCCLADFA